MSLKLDFYKQYDSLIAQTDYVHVSDNDSIKDENMPFYENTDLFNLLANYEYPKYDFTLEIFDDIQNIHMSFENLELAISQNL